MDAYVVVCIVLFVYISKNTIMAATKNEVNQAYEEALDDVHTRFILNLPDEELQSAPRIFFQLEQAW